MKKVVLGLTILSSLVFADKTFYLKNNPVVGCHKKSDAVNAEIALGMGKINQLKEIYLNTGACMAFMVDMKPKFKIINTTQAPLGKSHTTIYHMALIEANGEKAPKGMNLYFSDIAKTLEKSMK